MSISKLITEILCNDLVFRLTAGGKVIRKYLKDSEFKVETNDLFCEHAR